MKNLGIVLGLIGLSLLVLGTGNSSVDDDERVERTRTLVAEQMSCTEFSSMRDFILTTESDPNLTSPETGGILGSIAVGSALTISRSVGGGSCAEFMTSVAATAASAQRPCVVSPAYLTASNTTNHSFVCSGGPDDVLGALAAISEVAIGPI